MSTNRPNIPQQNRPQQPNRPQQSQRPQTITTPNVLKTSIDEKSIVLGISEADEGKVFNDLSMKDMTKENTMPQHEDSNQPLFTPETTLRELLRDLIVRVIDGTITSNQSQHLIHDWYKQLTPEKKLEFKQAYTENDHTINYFRSVIETLYQELPSLYIL